MRGTNGGRHIAERNTLSRLANALVPGHTVPAMLMLLYAIPAAFGLYAFRDRYALLVATCLGASIGFYYVGYFAAGSLGWVRGGRPIFPAAIRTPKVWKTIAIVTLVLYAALVAFLAITAKHVALLVALKLGDASQIARARDAFVETRVGWETALRYLNAILFRVAVPCIVVALYLRRHPWRHAILAAALFCALLTLEKSLTAFILVPLAVALLLANRTQALKALGVAAAFVLGATALAAGFMGTFAGREAGKHELLVTELSGDRKNLFWVIDTPPGAELQRLIAKYRPKFNVMPDGMIRPFSPEGGGRGTNLTDNEQQKNVPQELGSPGRTSTSGRKGSESVAQRFSAKEGSPGRANVYLQNRASRGKQAPALSPDQWASLGLRNLIINGDMEIAQSGVSDNVENGENSPLPSRWHSVASVPGRLAERIVAHAPKGFKRSVQLSTISSHMPSWGEAFELEQRIEGYKIKDLAFGTGGAQAITLSFWVRATVPGTYNVTIVNGLWTRSYLTSYTIRHADAWEHEVLTIPGDRTGSKNMWPQGTRRSLVVSFNFGAGAPYVTSRVDTWQNGFLRESPGTVALVSHPSATLEITGVQLERGKAATPFERTPLGLERQLVRHYVPPTTFQVLLMTMAGALPHPFEESVKKVLADRRTTQILRQIVRQTKFIVNRVAWIPYITAYDWFHFQHDILHGRFLRGRTIGPLAFLLGDKRYPAVHEIFKYQFGYAATSTGTSNAVYFADAYLNFGFIGVIIYSLAIGVIFRLIASCRNAAISGVSVMSTFGLMVASFTANMLSGGLGLLVLLALLLRGGSASTSERRGHVTVPPTSEGLDVR